MDKYDSIIAKLVQRNILTKETGKLVRIKAKNSSADVSSTVTQLMKKLKVLDKDSEQIDEYLKDLHSVLGSVSVTAAGGKSKTQVLKDLESHLKILSTISAKLKESKSIGDRIESLGKKDTSNFLKKARAVIKRYEAQYKEAKETLSKFSEKQRPAVLSYQKNDFLASVINWMDSKIDEYNETLATRRKAGKTKNKNAILDIDASEYMMEPSDTNKKILKFTRFMPLRNLPLTDGGTIDLYAMFEVDMITYEQKKNVIKPTKVSPLYITIYNEVLPPNKMPIPNRVSSLRELQDVLDNLSDRYGLTIFGVSAPKNPEERRQKISSKLDILKDKNIKIATKGPLIRLLLPKKYAAEVTGEETSPFNMKLWWDIARFAGIEVSRVTGTLDNIPLYLKYTKTFLSRVSTKKNPNGTVTLIYRIIKKPNKLVPRSEGVKDGDGSAKDDISQVTDADIKDYKKIADNILKQQGKQKKDDFDEDILEEKSAEQLKKERDAEKKRGGRSSDDDYDEDED